MTSSDIIIGEIVGTALLILMGAGVVAAVSLKKSKAKDSGWIVVTFGWGFGVLIGAYAVAGVSGAHLNPAVTIGLAVEGGIPWSDVPLYIASEMVGAMLGAFFAWVAYYGQFKAHLADLAGPGGPGAQATVEAEQAKAGPVLGVFSTGPEIRNTAQNLATEIIATFVLIIAILTQGLNEEGTGLGGLGPLIVALTVVGIGLSLGGPTGYAINPARDLGPRIVHALLPMRGKGGSDWGYAWIPIVGPIIGAVAAGLLYNVAFA